MLIPHNSLSLICGDSMAGALHRTMLLRCGINPKLSLAKARLSAILFGSVQKHKHFARLWLFVTTSWSMPQFQSGSAFPLRLKCYVRGLGPLQFHMLPWILHGKMLPLLLRGLALEMWIHNGLNLQHLMNSASMALFLHNLGAS